MINMKPLTMFSHLIVAKLHSIICDQDFREPKAIYDILPKK